MARMAAGWFGRHLPFGTTEIYGHLLRRPMDGYLRPMPLAQALSYLPKCDHGVIATVLFDGHDPAVNIPAWAQGS